jgi:hypothetical protein
MYIAPMGLWFYTSEMHNMVYRAKFLGLGFVPPSPQPNLLHFSAAPAAPRGRNSTPGADFSASRRFRWRAVGAGGPAVFLDESGHRQILGGLSSSRENWLLLILIC